MALQKTSLPILLLVIALGVSITVLGLLSTTRTVSNTGNIKGIGLEVYKDSSFSQKLTSIDWGSLNPGDVKTFNIYVRNEGNVNITLSISTGNWSPASASNYISLSWNRQNYPLVPGASVQATLTLSVSQSITGINSFSFDIIITGTEKA